MRNSDPVTVPSDYGRDAGKIFLITERPAIVAEKWAWRLAIALKGTSGAIKEELTGLGMVGVAIQGINAILAADIRFDLVEPLLDELLESVSIIRDPKTPHVVQPLKPEMDIEEVRTVAWLRSEVIRVHTGFSLAGALSKWISVLNSMASAAS